MGGIIGLILVVIGLVLLYDVVAGKSLSIVDLLNGASETATPVGPAGGIRGS